MAEKNYEWLTPPWVLKALGPFDLDPCAPIVRPWDMAAKHYTKEDDGLIQPWNGRVWMNPPYGEFAQIWLNKLGEYRNGIALVPVRSGSPWFHRQVFEKGDAVLFLEDRLWFYNIHGEEADGNAGHDSILIAYNKMNIEMLGDSGIKGHFQLLNAVPVIIISSSRSWKTVVGLALNRAAGEADIQDIYEMVELLEGDKCKKNKNWKAKVRQKLQAYFSRTGPGRYKNIIDEDQKN